MEQPYMRWIGIYSNYTVDLWRGWFRSEIRVFRNTDSGIGGLILRKKTRRKNDIKTWGQIVRILEG